MAVLLFGDASRTSSPRATPQVAVAASTQSKAALRYVVEGDGNKARYRVRERLFGREFDNDAVGETPKVTGAIALDAAGKVVPSESFFTAELAPLTSDESRRDNFVRRRVLVTDSFPTTTLRITEVRGLPNPLPTSGNASFQLVGQLTVKGVTRPTTWTVSGSVLENGNKITGTASTRFTFDEFQLEQPRVRMVLSLSDTIGLEYDFVMVKK